MKRARMSIRAGLERRVEANPFHTIPEENRP
jgi:hypothetical protein